MKVNWMKKIILTDVLKNLIPTDQKHKTIILEGAAVLSLSQGNFAHCS